MDLDGDMGLVGVNMFRIVYLLASIQGAACLAQVRRVEVGFKSSRFH